MNMRVTFQAHVFEVGPDSDVSTQNLEPSTREARTKYISVHMNPQARHGKKRRLEETLNMGFNIESEDEMGNTLLLVAVQQLQVRSFTIDLTDSDERHICAP